MRGIVMVHDGLVWLMLFGLLACGVPIFVSLGVATTAVLFLTDIPLVMIPLDLYKVSEMFPLVAVAAFVLAGCIMERGGLAQEIVNVASIFFGHVRGGLGIVTIIGCMFFAAMIGSGPGTVAAMGALMIPAMVRAGYKKEYATGVCCTGGTLGILIPPSNPMIVYGVIGNVSVSALFTAGFVPGFLVGLALMATAVYFARKANFPVLEQTYTAKQALMVVWHAKWSLLAPVVILGGIYTGAFTPVEASIVAVVYSFIIGWFVHKKLDWNGLKESLAMTNGVTGTVLAVVGVSILFGRFVTMYQVPQRLAEAVLSVSTDPIIVLSAITIFLFFLGMFLETLSTIVILTPVVLPLLKKIGVDPVHFGILLVMTNEVALLSPPLGVNLFVAAKISGMSLEKVSKAAFPYMCVIIVLCFLVILFPEIPLFLPKALGIYK